MDKFNKQQSGQQAERDACQFLQARGLRLIQANYRCYFGEIDLIMKDKDYVVFVEVRKRHNPNYGNALESINKTKAKKIIKTAAHFMQERNWLYKVASRFDIIAIHPIAGQMQLEWFRNAFTTDIA
ncbi:MAG: hypothetical protein ACD_46C00428G0005 [uncultured bacterium]|nr:MAG: hypothetical protein ACD_46C00428G0005 [uncultured bacterium]